jgi:hypothetical protein
MITPCSSRCSHGRYAVSIPPIYFRILPKVMTSEKYFGGGLVVTFVNVEVFLYFLLFVIGSSINIYVLTLKMS